MRSDGAFSRLLEPGDLMHTPAPKAARLTAVAVTYAGRSDQISAVRADLRRLLDCCPIADDIVLCTSELATNSVVHSYSGGPGGTFTVHAEVAPGDYTWIEVQDDGGPWAPGLADTARPHGLDIVAALATDWGVDGDYRTRTVWARFDWPGA